jgi:hypothetical protein
MGFRQLYYTSCKQGLAGYPGYQFNAATPGLDADLMREVEALTSYEAPRSLRSTASDEEIRRSPVNLCYLPGPPAVVANVVFVGLDYSQRFGNYFAHSLVTAQPTADFSGVLPIELWRAPGLWASHPVDDTTLDELPAPPVTGPLSRETVARFLAVEAEGDRLPALLTAVERAIVEDERKVVIINVDVDHTAKWIAAVSYLLPPSLVGRMSFATYERQPRYSRPHVIGTVPDAEVDRGDAGFDNYYLFDFPANRASEFDVHPLARMLDAVGTELAPQAWREADKLARGGERSFDDWHPVFTAAMMVWREGPERVRELALEAPDAVAAWLKENAFRLGPATVSAIGSATLGSLRPDAGDRPVIRPLADLAAAAHDTGLSGLTVPVERAGVDDVLRRVRVGARITDAIAVPVTMDETRQYATGKLGALFPTAPPAVAFSALAWAEQVGLRIEAPLLRRLGERVAAPVALDRKMGDQVRDAVRAWPELRAGAVDELVVVADREQSRIVDAIVHGGLTELFDLREADAAPALREAMILARVQTDGIDRLSALEQIVDLRRKARANSPVDPALIRLLWPDPPWRPSEALAVLGLLRGREVLLRPIPDWLGGSVTASVDPADDHEVTAYEKLCEHLDGNAALFDKLPPSAQDRITELAHVDGLVNRIVRAKNSTEFQNAFDNLWRDYKRLGDAQRGLLDGRLSASLTQLSANRGAALVVHFPDMRARYVAELRTAVARSTRDVQAAATAYALAFHLRHPKADREEKAVAAEIERAFFRALRKWPRRRLREVKRELGGRREAVVARDFGTWLGEETGGVRRLRLVRVLIPTSNIRAEPPTGGKGRGKPADEKGKDKKKRDKEKRRGKNGKK